MPARRPEAHSPPARPLTPPARTATLVLLLAVSAAIVVRSYLIRRRQRRLLDAAVRDGLLAPGAPAFAPRGALPARRPELADVYLGSAPAEKARRLSVASEDTGTSARSLGVGWWNPVMVSTCLCVRLCAC